MNNDAWIEITNIFGNKAFLNVSYPYYIVDIEEPVGYSLDICEFRGINRVYSMDNIYHENSICTIPMSKEALEKYIEENKFNIKFDNFLKE